MYLVLQHPSNIVTGMYQHGLKPAQDYETRELIVDKIAHIHYGPYMGRRKCFQITLKDRGVEGYQEIAKQLGWEVGKNHKGEDCLVASCLDIGGGLAINAAGECWQTYEFAESK